MWCNMTPCPFLIEIEINQSANFKWRQIPRAQFFIIYLANDSTVHRLFFLFFESCLVSSSANFIDLLKKLLYNMGVLDFLFL